MNILDSTLKHNMEIALKNAIAILLEPEKFTTGQRLDARDGLKDISNQLIFINSPDIEKDAINHNFSNAIENELELDVNGARFVENLFCVHGRELITN